MNDAQAAPPPGVAVFGSSEPEPGSPLYESARAVGAALGAAGVPAVTGGYGGVMEAASRGAREAGGEAIGITCQLFRARSPNRWLTLEIEEPDLFTRTGRLVALSGAFVIVEGGAGTLAELAMLWALARARALPGPIVLLDGVWEQLYADLAAAERLDGRCRDATLRADGPEEAARLAIAGLAG